MFRAAERHVDWRSKSPTPSPPSLSPSEPESLSSDDASEPHDRDCDKGCNRDCDRGCEGCGDKGHREGHGEQCMIFRSSLSPESSSSSLESEAESSDSSLNVTSSDSLLKVSSESSSSPVQVLKSLRSLSHSQNVNYDIAQWLQALFLIETWVSMMKITKITEIYEQSVQRYRKQVREWEYNLEVSKHMKLAYVKNALRSE